ncbi:MAG: DUF3237 domain-containing protein [Hyphomonadaceae bacterium]|nr:DUF3237 domain-containing protein [Hyphomonadaceae bacterium]
MDHSAPALEHVFTLAAHVAPPIELGEAQGMRRRVVPIIDGTITGPRFEGIILPGGADWQRIRPSDGLSRLVATYAIRHADGTIVQVENRGLRRASPETMARLNAGEIVDPALVYFRSAPVFDAPDGPHAWLNESLFIAAGRRRPDRVEIDVYSLG